MSTRVFYLFSSFAASLPYLTIAAVFVYYLLRRAQWKIDRRRGKQIAGFCPSSAALGVMLLFTQVFVRPSLQYVLEEKLDEDVDEDDEGDPEGTLKQLAWQLKRIRRGEPVGDLILRL